MAGTVNNSTQNHSAVEKVESYEVGWLFVQQYYSVLNEDPTRLHCFYTKKSTQTIGGEGESVPLCHGQQEIHNRFIELDFRDCRVLVSNVDSQASLDGGIVIQVLGEIANKGGPSKKFCQTFFLAEQPNGYFVLNDIFRYLKDEVETDYEANPSLEEPTEIAEAQPEAPVAEAPAKVEQAPVQPVVAEAQPVKPKAPEPTPAKQEVPEQKSIPEPAKAEAKASPSAPVSTKPEAAATPAAAPAPAAAKSWATLAANNSDRWGSNASATQGVVAPAAKPQQSTPAPQQQAGRNMSNKDNRSKNDDLVVFVRNVNESITQDVLSQAFSAFGTVKSVDLFHTKNSAFVEFEDVEHVKAAIAQGTISVGGHNLIAEKKRSRAPQGSSQNTGSGPRTGSQGGSYERNNSRRGGRGNTRGGRPSGDRQPAK